jgi:hypothetical protein
MSLSNAQRSLSFQSVLAVIPFWSGSKRVNIELDYELIRSLHPPDIGCPSRSGYVILVEV